MRTEAKGRNVKLHLAVVQVNSGGDQGWGPQKVERQLTQGAHFTKRQSISIIKIDQRGIYLITSFALSLGYFSSD